MTANHKRLLLPTLTGLLSIHLMASADVLTVSPGEDLQDILDSMSAGDELIIEAGTYTLQSGLKIDLPSTADQPSTIRARDNATVLIDLPSQSYNIVEVRSSQYLTIKGRSFTGGSHGIRLMDSDFVTIEECEIYETGDVALSANSGGTYEGLVIRNNHIHHTNGTGEGMYLGCNNDGCRVANSVIEGNYVHHTNRASVEQGDGIELKEGSYGNIVRDNVIHDTNYPGILTYSTVGNGGPNIIEGNLIWSSNDYGIQSAADSIIRNNIILGETVGMQQHQAGSPSNIQFVHNTIITTENAIEVRDVSGDVLIANNAIYSQSGLAINLISGDRGRVTIAGNVGIGDTAGISDGFTSGDGIDGDFVDARFGAVPPVDVFPAAGGSLVNAGSSDYAAQIDFNGTPRGGLADAGAYRYNSNGNPGWGLAIGFKDVGYSATRPNPPADLQTNPD